MIQFLANPAFLRWLQRTESLKLLSNPGLQLPPLFPHLGGARQCLEFRGKCAQCLIERTHKLLLWDCRYHVSFERTCSPIKLINEKRPAIMQQNRAPMRANSRCGDGG